MRLPFWCGRREEIDQLRHVESFFGEGEGSVIDHFAGGVEKRCEGSAAKSGADTDAAHPEGSKFADGERRHAFHSHKHIDRFADRGADGANVVGARDSGGIKDLGTCGFKGLQAADGVVQVGVAVEIVFRARDEHEGEW